VLPKEKGDAERQKGKERTVKKGKERMRAYNFWNLMYFKYAKNSCENRNTRIPFKYVMCMQERKKEREKDWVGSEH